MKMKKLYMIFALALSAIFALQPQIQADGRDVIGGGLLGATVGGIAGGGKGAAIGAGVGALSGAAVGSTRAQDRYYYDDYDDYDDYDYGYYPRERYYRGGYYRGGGYYGPGVGIGVGLPFFMDVNNEIYSRDTMEDFPRGYYPRNRNYMPGLNAPDYKQYWQKEGFFPPQEYEVELGAPRDGYSSSCDITTNVETISDVTLITPEDEGLYFDSGSQRPLRPLTTTTENVVAPVAEATADVVESIGQATADIVRPVAQATGSTVRSIGEAIEDAATPNPIIEEEDIVIMEPVEPTTYTAPAITNRRPISYNRGSVVRPVAEVTEDVVEPVAATTARTAERVGEATADVVAPVAEAAEEVVTAPLRLFQ